ncbi:hypothetical protein [Arthrobacter sp. zg-Y1110]|uniref:hypothetical protein n=1 Tax=Arthrobacter sp. zg-Y1110 TaxID=2886932 RepID=UPI001D152962|nr:hypothetical protein [Arthrobacter sp. zg-Y1110]MCC3292885.1 hypothetical protein [Arthrobacter sp. zg-Y1110]UWX86823.1 hypothetical protein N2K99_18445 [Arthrobacter sp. zg-Y1110]
MVALSTLRKVEGVAIIVAVSLCAAVMTVFTRPSELRRIPAKSMEMIRYMLRD